MKEKQTRVTHGRFTDVENYVNNPNESLTIIGVQKSNRKEANYRKVPDHIMIVNGITVF